MLDLGVGATANREIARLSVGGSEAAALPSIVVSYERWYWLTAGVIGLALFLGLPALTTWWLHSPNVPSEAVLNSARVFAVIAMLQWATSFYAIALMGLQKQVALNAIQVPFGAIVSLGGLLVIWWGPRSITALLTWQAAMLAVQYLIVYRYFWTTIGFKPRDGQVRFSVLRNQWRFSAGMTGISTTGFIIINLDKWILSRLLTLEAFAQYSLAVTLSRGLYVLITPVFSTYFPRLSSLMASGDASSIRECYHTATQVMAALILPLAAVVALFSHEIMQVWLHNEGLAAVAAPLASVLVIGTCLNGLMNIPFAAQLAQGNTRIGLITNIGLLVFLVPSIIWATINYGALGGAIMWAAANAAYMLIGIPVTHAYVVAGGSRTWLLTDVLPPALAAFIIALIARALVPSGLASIWALLAVGAAWMAATGLAFASSPRVRAKLATHLR